jgi:pyruvate formate lyase activating enzyme
VKRDWLYYLNTDGGLTLSGGEPLQQMDFAISLLKGAAELGLSTCVETCGYVPPGDLLKAAQYTDLFLYDLKCMDDTLHAQYVGVSNQLILENARLLIEKGIRTIFGIPLIPGITDTGDNIRATADFVSKLRSSTRKIRLLPYHRFGISKFKQLGYSYKLHDLPLCDKETIEKVRDIIVNDFKLECEVIGSWS